MAALAAAFRQRGLRPGDRARAGAAQPPGLPAGLDRRRDAWARSRSASTPGARSTSSATPASTAARPPRSCPRTARTTSRRRCPALGFLAVSAGGAHGADAVAALADGGAGRRRSGSCPRGAGLGAVHVGHDRAAEGRRLDPGQLPVGRAGRRRATRGSARPTSTWCTCRCSTPTRSRTRSSSSLWSGGQVVLVPKFSASRFWDVSVRHGATWTSVVSFCLRALADREVPERAPLPRLGRQRAAWTPRRSPAACRSSAGSG